MAEMKRDYEIEALSKALRILQALEAQNFAPARLEQIADDTGYPANYCYRAMKTLEKHGWAVQKEKLWHIGPKLIRLAQTAARIG